MRKKRIWKKPDVPGHDTEGPKGRNAKGHFLPGSAHRKGLTSEGTKNRVHNRALFDKIMKESNVEKLVKKMLSLALSGNYPALQYMLDRCMGREKFELEVSGDGQITFTLDLGKKLETTEPKQIEEDTNIIDVIPIITKEKEKIASDPINNI